MPRETQQVLTAICLRNTDESESASSLYFKCLVETEGLPRVVGSHVHCKCGNISETVRERRCCYGPLIGSQIWPIKEQQFR